MSSGVGGATTPADFVGLSDVSEWVSLLKPRVVQLVVFTGIIGIEVAPSPLHPVLALTAVLCIGGGAGAAGAINMWFDRDIDAIMRRTSGRPIPAGRIAADAALGFGVVLAATSVLLLYLATNAVAAAILACSIGFYVGVYTIWLKRLTPNNIVIGGAAGAFPPLIGWAAATGSINALPMLMFAIIFLWTPPHFWALSLYAHDDYARAGVPMLPVVRGARATREHIALYTSALALVSVVPWFCSYSGPFYGIFAIGLGGGFMLWAWFVLSDKQDLEGRSLTNDRSARKMFRYSLLYLFALFSALAVDHWAW